MNLTSVLESLQVLLIHGRLGNGRLFFKQSTGEGLILSLNPFSLLLAIANIQARWLVKTLGSGTVTVRRVARTPSERHGHGGPFAI